MNKFSVLKKNRSMRFLLILFILALCLLTLFVYKKIYLDARADTVYITKNGFVPAGIKIRKGETVKFVSKINKPFWIASDPHPTHTNFSAFDSGRVDNNFYEFKFDNLGTYRYHDHLNPDYRGVVNVVDMVDINTSEKCGEITNLYEKKDCFLNILTEIQIKKGDVDSLNSGFEIVKDYPELVEECHNMAHTLGEYGYWRYSKTKKLIKSNQISFCGFGYVHGFMQELSHHQSNFISESKKYCDYFSKNIKYDNQDWEIAPEDTCYNGVGHGVLFLYLPQFENDLKSLIEISNKKCIEINNEKKAVDHCLQGVFSGVSGLFLGSHGYKKDLDNNDPFWLCRQLGTDFNSRCFANMVPAVGIVFNRDLDKLLVSIRAQDNAQAKNAIFLVGDIASNWYGLKYISLGDAVNACTKLTNENSLSCIKGFVSGLARVDKNLNDMLEIDICNQPRFSVYQKNECKLSYLTELRNVSIVSYETVVNNLSQSDKQLIYE